MHGFGRGVRSLNAHPAVYFVLYCVRSSCVRPRGRSLSECTGFVAGPFR